MLLWGMPKCQLVKNCLWTNPLASREEVPRENWWMGMTETCPDIMLQLVEKPLLLM